MRKIRWAKTEIAFGGIGVWLKKHLHGWRVLSVCLGSLIYLYDFSCFSLALLWKVLLKPSGAPSRPPAVSARRKSQTSSSQEPEMILGDGTGSRSEETSRRRSVLRDLLGLKNPGIKSSSSLKSCWVLLNTTVVQIPIPFQNCAPMHRGNYLFIGKQLHFKCKCYTKRESTGRNRTKSYEILSWQQK